MTREEAINALRCLITMPGFTANEALDMAIAALREQEERSKGCEYCGDPSPHSDCVVDGNIEQMLVGRSFADAYVYTRRIKFCPMCGRRLEEVCREQ